MTLPRTSPTKETHGVAIVSASHRSPLWGARPTTGSDEDNSSACPAGTGCLHGKTLTKRSHNLRKFKPPQVSRPRP